MYEDFEDLRDNCPAEIKALIAVDLMHDDQEKLDAVWQVTADGEFRLALNQAVTDFWEKAVRDEGGAAEQSGKRKAETPPPAQ